MFGLLEHTNSYFLWATDFLVANNTVLNLKMPCGQNLEGHGIAGKYSIAPYRGDVVSSIRIPRPQLLYIDRATRAAAGRTKPRRIPNVPAGRKNVFTMY